ncbi:phosphatidylglycerophosphatase A [Brassicibacter mesophilus]|jgi:phosphatidylglycerophosphatase A|uniref:phosphatidylglycerophosphatase A n=1 Tax=Brassicibacter mesophilus TaxID=745119 RepID=UPI003D25C5F7
MVNFIVELLESREITIQQIEKIVSILKKNNNENYSYHDSIMNVLSIKEVQDFAAIGLVLDIYAESNLFPEPIQNMLSEDDTLFCLDKSLALAVMNVFGSEAIINFSYLQKEKTAEIKEIIGNKSSIKFLDDVLCAIASAAAIDLY